VPIWFLKKYEEFIMENNTELVRLEQFVDTLLNKYNDLKGRFHALEGTLSEREETLNDRENECTALKQEIANLRDERSEVGGRVVGLIDRIEQWESEQGDAPSQDNSDEEKQGSLFDQDNGENQ
jgi:chromosome segregation ATPase